MDLPVILQRVLDLQDSYASLNSPQMQERGELVRRVATGRLRQLLPGDHGLPAGDFGIEGRDGTGLKARVPWIRLHSKKLSPRATGGWYIAFLFAANGNAVYLSLNQGTTTSTDGEFRARPQPELRRRVLWARELLKDELQGARRFETTIALEEAGPLAVGYEHGNVCAVRYESHELPTEAQIVDDLNTALTMLVILYGADESRDSIPEDEATVLVLDGLRPAFGLALLRTEVESRGLIIADRVLKVTSAALKSGKHVILTGPPGTAKTTYAEIVAGCAAMAGWSAGSSLTTATSDWTTYETVGGLRPTASGRLEFAPGQILSAIMNQQWLVIDELNRANFDRAFGQLFTVLSGQSVTLPYDDSGTQRPIQLTMEGAPSSPFNFQVVVPATWRLIARMNVFDKSLLFEMSFALMRRFAFIEVPAPNSSVYEALIRRQATEDVALADRLLGLLRPLLELRRFKQLGPALYIDMAKFAVQIYAEDDPTPGELSFQLFYSYLLPQFEGITDDTARPLYKSLRTIVGTPYAEELRRAFRDTLGVQVGSEPKIDDDADDEDELDDAVGLSSVE